MTDDPLPTPGRTVVVVGALRGTLGSTVARCITAAPDEITAQSPGLPQVPADAVTPDHLVCTLSYIAGRTIWRQRAQLQNKKGYFRFQPTGRPTLAIHREQISAHKALPTYVASLETKSFDLAQKQQQSTHLTSSSRSLKLIELTLYMDSVRLATELPLVRGMFVDLRVVVPAAGGAELIPLMGKVDKLTPRVDHNLALLSLVFPDVETEHAWEDFLCACWMSGGFSQHIQT